MARCFAARFYYSPYYNVFSTPIEPNVPAAIPAPSLASALPVPEPQTSASVIDPVLQQQMVASFSEQSGMNTAWSLK